MRAIRTTGRLAPIPQINHLSQPNKGREHTPNQNQTHLQQKLDFGLDHVLITVIEQLRTISYTIIKSSDANSDQEVKKQTTHLLGAQTPFPARHCEGSLSNWRSDSSARSTWLAEPSARTLGQTRSCAPNNSTYLLGGD